MTETADVVIVGGGLHGSSAAFQLARRGLRPLVVEKDYVARHASGVNAGGVRRLGRHPAEIPLSIASMEMWHGIADLLDDDCGFVHCGQVKVAESAADMEVLRARVAQVRALGFDHEELIDQGELRRLVPAISDHCVGGIVSRADGAADPYRTTNAFRRKAESLGARYREGTRALALRREGAAWRVETDRGAVVAPVVVNAAGAWADRIAAMVGERAPVEPSAFLLMISARLPRFIEPVLGATARPLSFKQFANGTVLIGGGQRGLIDRDRNWTAINFRGLASSARTVFDLFPAMRAATIVRTWAGIEGVMPDQIPVIGPSRTEEGIFHAFGFTGHGFQLGPVVGALMAELITTGHTNLPIAPFSIGRFSAGST
ncbi:MAG: FAD-binding oxidoreductase [Alphaproteobacteria bacterium]|nr:FAD-binding oxidoreductase [Alphaproteobacteria bacterium]